MVYSTPSLFSAFLNLLDLGLLASLWDFSYSVFHICVQRSAVSQKLPQARGVCLPLGTYCLINQDMLYQLGFQKGMQSFPQIGCKIPVRWWGSWGRIQSTKIAGFVSQCTYLGEDSTRRSSRSTSSRSVCQSRWWFETASIFLQLNYSTDPIIIGGVKVFNVLPN